MISNQILQSTIDGLKSITRIELCIVDTDGQVLATTFAENGKYTSSIIPFIESAAESQTVGNCQFFKIFDDRQLEYVLLAEGSGEEVYTIGRVAAFQIQNLIVALVKFYLKLAFFVHLF